MKFVSLSAANNGYASIEGHELGVREGGVMCVYVCVRVCHAVLCVRAALDLTGVRPNLAVCRRERNRVQCSSRESFAVRRCAA